VVLPIYNSVQFEKIKINCYRVGVAIVCPLSRTCMRHFQIPTAGPHVSHSELGNLVCAAYHQFRLDAGVRRRPKGLAQTSSLSAAYKDNDWWKISSPLHCFFLPAEVSITTARRQLAVALPDHSTIPLVELLLTPSCSFCPRFHDHRARAPASTTHAMGDLHQHR
jgi:hypothetical protein